MTSMRRSSSILRSSVLKICKKLLNENQHLSILSGKISGKHNIVLSNDYCDSVLFFDENQGLCGQSCCSYLICESISRF